MTKPIDTEVANQVTDWLRGNTGRDARIEAGAIRRDGTEVCPLALITRLGHVNLDVPEALRSTDSDQRRGIHVDLPMQHLSRVFIDPCEISQVEISDLALRLQYDDGYMLNILIVGT